MALAVALPDANNLVHLKYRREVRLLASQWFLSCTSEQERRLLIANLYAQSLDQNQMRWRDQIRAHFEEWKWVDVDDPPAKVYQATVVNPALPAPQSDPLALPAPTDCQRLLRELAVAASLVVEM